MPIIVLAFCFSESLIKGLIFYSNVQSHELSTQTECCSMINCLSDIISCLMQQTGILLCVIQLMRIGIIGIASSHANPLCYYAEFHSCWCSS